MPNGSISQVIFAQISGPYTNGHRALVFIVERIAELASNGKGEFSRANMRVLLGKRGIRMRVGKAKRATALRGAGADSRALATVAPVTLPAPPALGPRLLVPKLPLDSEAFDESRFPRKR